MFGEKSGLPEPIAAKDDARTPITLINPNTSQAATDMMVEITKAAAPAWRITGATAPSGPTTITNETELENAARLVAAMADGIDDRCSGIIVAAFGDPGLEALRSRLAIPVVGIAEASMIAAARGGRRFSIVVTLPGLVEAVRRRAEIYGIGDQLVSIRATDGPPSYTMANPALLRERLADAIALCAEQDGAEAVIIGGGPLAEAARALAAMAPVPLIEPVPEAVHRLREILRSHP